MNEQTKRLYELAHKEVIETCQYTGMPSVTYEFDPEKFTELIVRECDRYVAEHYDECEPWMQPGDLLKHFGVE